MREVNAKELKLVAGGATPAIACGPTLAIPGGTSQTCVASNGNTITTSILTSTSSGSGGLSIAGIRNLLSGSATGTGTSSQTTVTTTTCTPTAAPVCTTTTSSTNGTATSSTSSTLGGGSGAPAKHENRHEGPAQEPN